jgi:hypothetical protein
VRESVFYGPPISAAYDAIVELFLEGGRRLERRISVGAPLEMHLTRTVVLFDSRAWIVTARKASQPPRVR